MRVAFLLALLALASGAWAGDWCKRHPREPHLYVLLNKQAMA